MGRPQLAGPQLEGHLGGVGHAVTHRPSRWTDGPAAVLLLSAALALAGVALLRVLGSPAPALPLWAPLVCLVLLAVGFASAESFVVHLPLGRHAQSFSLSEVPVVVGLFVAAPWVVVVARLLGSGTALVRLRLAPVKLVFGLAQFTLEISVIATVWTALLGSAAPLSPRGWGAVIVAVAVGDILSGLLVTLAMRLHGGELEPDAYREAFTSGIVPALANGALGLTVVFVAALDWRALWLPGVVTAMLFGAHRANLVLRRRHDTLQRLNEFTGDVGSHLQVDTLAVQVLAQLRDQLQADHAALTVHDADGQERVWRSEGAPDLDAVRGATATLLKRTTRDPQDRALLDAVGVKDAMAVRLPGDEGSLGHVVVADRLGDYETFGDDDLEILHALANHTAAALRNAQLADQLRLQVTENEHRALHDALTDLPNRRLFAQRVAEAHGPVAVLMMDLDGFKDVNDALGHATGDVLLQLVAARLAEHLADARCIARIGGDEFVIALDVAAPQEALAQAEDIRSLLVAPFALVDMTLSVDASIGVAVGPGGNDGGELLKQADIAMYDAKASRAGVRLYDAARDRSSPERLLLPSELRDAIANGGLTVHYQPKAALATDAIESFEALVRWQHPRRGLVSPAEFIPLAEQTGLIVELTDVVLRAALAECLAWRDAGHSHLSVAVNMSPRVLHDDDLPGRLAMMLADAELDAGALTLEITESDLMADPARAVALLQLLSDMGIKLSVDDLGTGYSSLAYLKRLPVHEVKIDRSFVMNMQTDADDAAIVEAVVALGQRLGKRVVAEGIEDAETYAALRDMGCDVAQGYWLARPMPADQVRPWLTARASRHTAAVAAAPTALTLVV